MALEILTSLLVVVLAVATVYAAIVGLLGSTGALRLLRCERCAHLVITSGFRAPGTCGYCRHDRLLHPFYARHHAHHAYWSDHVLERRPY